MLFAARAVAVTKSTTLRADEYDADQHRIYRSDRGALLIKVSAAVTDVVGEEGLSRLIVANIRDCFRLDAMCRIRSATSFEIVLNEMRQYPKDASFCLVGLKRSS